MKTNAQQKRRDAYMRAFRVLTATKADKQTIEIEDKVGCIPSFENKVVNTIFSLRKRFYVKSVRELRMEETERMICFQ